MRLLFGKRVGQSDQELVPAVLFSLALHVLFFFIALLLYGRAVPRIHVPPFYQVTIVDQALDLPDALPQAPPAPAAEPKPPVKAAKPEAAPKKELRKDAMPELKPQKPAAEKPREDEMDRPAAPAQKQQAVALSVAPEFKFPPYLALIREKIERNWNPPPGAKGIRATVTFKILRSGRVVDATPTQSSGNFYFDQAAMRAILVASPFPPLPEGFFREFEVFSVDLMERE